ncbi:hypothetical protein GGI35DRAFT_432062 [Trichoderma velutinum]
MQMGVAGDGMVIREHPQAIVQFFPLNDIFFLLHLSYITPIVRANRRSFLNNTFSLCNNCTFIMMETILEDEAEASGLAPADPDIPPLFYVESIEQPSVYRRSFKLTDNVFPPYLDPIPSWMKSMLAMDAKPLIRDTAPDMFPPLFFYSASQPLPSEFIMPFKDRPKSFYISLTHDNSLVNIYDSSPKVWCGPAAQRVFRTPELMENIFLKLDMATVLTSIQRVNKTFKQVVDGSLALQRMLYFKFHKHAETGLHPQAQYNGDDRMEFPILNSLLVKHFGSCFFDFGGVYGWQRRAESFYENKWTRHHHKLKADMMFGRQKIYRSVGPELDGLETLQASQDRERFTRAGASWRRMLVCQPPIYDFGAMIFQPVEPSQPLPQMMEKAIIEAEDDESGLCMGQLYDFVQERAGNHPLDSLWFRLTWFENHGSFASDLCHRTAIEWVIDGVPVVIEMFHKKDSLPPFHPPDPPKLDVFDKNFKCKDFKPHEWVPDETVIDCDGQGYESASPLSGKDKQMIWSGFPSMWRGKPEFSSSPYY